MCLPARSLLGFSLSLVWLVDELHSRVVPEMPPCALLLHPLKHEPNRGDARDVLHTCGPEDQSYLFQGMVGTICTVCKPNYSHMSSLVFFSQPCSEAG
ncbi:hypothetical protein B0J14DRAFT_586558 [Halenospora varia]|nr:hypothetical protein B0J14DRAFT_586558 [Halenospora varia]